MDLWSTEKDPSLFIVNLNNKFGINYIDKINGLVQIIIKIIVIIILIAIIYIKRKKLGKGSGINV
ncbi:hypothetical protein [Clostridium sp. CT7]|uniref:hypothetical protein n=1 Tax=Clostridium sp. CT7 TaxID=2052574 RepID=UPI001112BFBB|nr:hypothetical protein [Clostridium sp. CT7]